MICCYTQSTLKRWGWRVPAVLSIMSLCFAMNALMMLVLYLFVTSVLSWAMYCSWFRFCNICFVFMFSCFYKFWEASLFLGSSLKMFLVFLFLGNFRPLESTMISIFQIASKYWLVHYFQLNFLPLELCQCIPSLKPKCSQLMGNKSWATHSSIGHDPRVQVYARNFIGKLHKDK